MKNYENILVIKLSAFGDFLYALGAMKDIRNHYSDAKITVLTTAPYETLAKATGYFDAVLIDERIRIKKEDLKYKILKNKVASVSRFKSRLRDFDLVVDLQINDRTTMYYYLYFPFKKPDWSGRLPFAKYRNFKKGNVSGKKGLENPMVKLGIKNPSLPEVSWIKEDISRLELPKKYVLLVSGCAPSRPLKRWSAVSYGRLANMLLEMGYNPVLVGTDADKAANDKIKEICPKAIDLTNKTSMLELGVVGRHASLCVTNDTGPAFMISLSECPTLVLFSNDSSPTQSLPPAKKVSFIQKPNLDDLKPEEVLEKLKTLGYLK